MSSSPMEDYSNLTFPCFPVLFPQTHGTYYIDSTLLMSTSSFNPSALPTSPAIPPHLVLLSSAAPALLTPALAGGWLSCAPGNLVLLFFPPQKQGKPQKTCPPSFLLKSKQTSNSSSKPQPSLPQRPSSSPARSSYLRHQVLGATLLSLSPQYSSCNMNTRGEELWTSYVMMDCACCEQPCLTHRGPRAEHLSPGSCEGGRGEWPCSPQLIEGASTSKDRSGILCGINPKVYARTRNIFPAFWLNKQMALPPKIAVSTMQFQRGRNFLT